MLKFVLAILSMAICLAMNHWIISVMILLSMSYLTVGRGGMKVRQYLKLLKIPLFFLIIGVLTIMINITSQPMDLIAIPVFSKYISIGRQEFLDSMMLIFKAFGTVACLYFLSLSTPMFEITQVLNRLHCPKIFTELMILIYRFIFVLMDTCHMMMLSADSRLGYLTKRSWMKTTASIAGSLFLKSFKRSVDMYNAMEARCYDGSLEFLYEKKPASKGQIAGVCLFIAAVAAIGVLLKIKGW